MSLLRAPITNKAPQAGWLTECKSIVSQFWKQAVQDHGVSRVGPSQGREGGSALGSPLASGTLRCFSSHRQPCLPVSLSTIFPLCMCVFHVSCCIKTPLILEHGPPDSSMTSSPLTTSTVTLNNVTFCGRGG